MTREELEAFILDYYQSEANFPWLNHPRFEVFRHTDNHKWFALIMDVPANKLGLKSSELLDIVNLKIDPFLISSLKDEESFFPAYHMNKKNWISVALDGSVPADKIKALLDMSFQSTASKRCPKSRIQ